MIICSIYVCCVFELLFVVSLSNYLHIKLRASLNFKPHSNIKDRQTHRFLYYSYYGKVNGRKVSLGTMRKFCNRYKTQTSKWIQSFKNFSCIFSDLKISTVEIILPGNCEAHEAATFNWSCQTHNLYLSTMHTLRIS